jgi:hypothetical protein
MAKMSFKASIVGILMVIGIATLLIASLITPSPSPSSSSSSSSRSSSLFDELNYYELTLPRHINQLETASLSSSDVSVFEFTAFERTYRIIAHASGSCFPSSTLIITILSDAAKQTNENYKMNEPYICVGGLIDMFGENYHEVTMNGDTGAIIDEKRGNQVQKDCWLTGIICVASIVNC